MRTFLFLLLLLSFSQEVKSQAKRSFAELALQISNRWKEDSTSCKGYRMSVAREVLNTQYDRIKKEFIILNLGKPNYVQEFFSGNTGKTYVSYIYYVYKDNCPVISVEGYAIQFVLDESETYLVEITDIEYCG